MKISAFTLLVWVICVKSFSQATNIDALNKELVVASHDTGRAMILADLSYFYRLLDTDTGLTIGYKALELARKYQFKKGESAALNSIAKNYQIKGDLLSTMPPLLEALRLAQNHPLPAQLAEALVSMGNTYVSLKDYPTAIRYLKDAIEIHKNLASPVRRSGALAHLGEAFLLNGQLESGQYYLDKAYELIKKENYFAGLNFYYTRSARLNLLKKNARAAYGFIKEAERLSHQEKNTRSLMMVYQLYSDYYKGKNAIDSAIYFSQAAFDLAKKYTYQWDLLATSDQLSSLYESKDLEKAFFFSQLSRSLNDSLYGPDRANALQQRIIQEQEKVRESEARGLASQNRLKQNALLIVLSITGLIGLFLYRNNREKQRTNNLLSEQKAEIEKQKNQVEITLTELKSTQALLIQQEKMASLGELTAGIAHEIQNPLNFVNNFSDVNKELAHELGLEIDKGNYPDAKTIAKDIKDNEEKINHHGKRADAIVKGMLQHSRTGSSVKELTDINALCDEYLRLAYHGYRAKDKSFNAKTETDFEANIPKINVVAQEIGRVIFNLINNAFYAVSSKASDCAKASSGKLATADSGYKPAVVVSTKKTNGNFEIRVYDNGYGIPQNIINKIFQPFFTTKPPGQGTGLGLSLSYDIVKAHGGEMKVETSQGEGSTFTIQLPFSKNE